MWLAKRQDVRRNAKCWRTRGDTKKANLQMFIAKKVIDAFSDDYLEDKLFHATIYDYLQNKQKEIENMLNE